MREVLDFILGIPATKYVMGLGGLGMFTSAVSQELFGYQIAEGMNVIVFAICGVITAVGFIGHIKLRQIKLEYTRLDYALREKKLDKGVDPSLDKTLIKQPGEPLE